MAKRPTSLAGSWSRCPTSSVWRLTLARWAKEIFDSVALTQQTEFHGSYIYFGKGPFKGMEPAKRIDILSKLAAMIEHGTPVKRVYAAIDTEKT